MDHRLVAWARSVKARRGPGAPPPLWLFTDAGRMPDLKSVIGALPRRLCGVVFRHDGVADRAALLHRVGRLCRGKRIPLVVAGDHRGAPPWAGRHLRGGRGRTGRIGLVTSSAHTRAEVIRATRAGARLIFLSPTYATSSHPAARPLGPIRFASMIRSCPGAFYALGGVTGRTAKRLPHGVFGAGAIGALVP